MSDHSDETLSRSARKREAEALQDLGETLIGLRQQELDALPLPEQLREAVELARRIKGRGGLRRQRQLIGKLMRQLDTEALQAALAGREQREAEERRRFHQLEQLRDRLLEDEAALGEVLERWPHADRQRLRQLARAAREERDAQRPPASARKLFRMLRELDDP